MLARILHIGGVVIAGCAAIGGVIYGAVTGPHWMTIMGAALTICAAVAIYDGATATVRLSNSPTLHPVGRFEGLSDKATYVILAVFAAGAVGSGIAFFVMR